MAGYTRNDTSNNIATGNVINAADLDGEFDALVAAFHASTGHTHDGTAANGAPITKIGPAQDLVISTGAITPKTDNTVDLGSSSFEFKDLYIDGTANIDALVADTADINAGTIDGVTLGTNSAVTEAQIDNININGNTISSTDTNGNISLVPNGTGDVILTADTIQVGDSNTDVTVTTNGTGDLIFNTNAGTNSGVIRIYDGANGNIALTPNGTGEVDISKVDIDSGAIDGTAIGANSASTGAFTTLSASSTVTLSGGTANGVLYLNGSKVATSGSALTFDGTTATTPRLALGGTTLPAAGTATLFSRSSDNNTYLQTGSGNSFLVLDGSQNTMFQASPTFLGFNISNSEQMRLTSTGLGIGTSSPSVKLHVKAATASADVFYAVNSNNKGLNLNTTSSDNLQISHTNSNYNIDYWVSGTGVHTFSTGGSERMRLDSSGNLGLGVTPSAWTVGKAIEINSGGNAVWGLGTNSVQLVSNYYYDGSYRYKANGYANRYDVGSSTGIHAWFTAPSGTAGNAITFTQAMTLDASGRLGVGTTNPSVASGIGVVVYNSNGAARFVMRNNSTGDASTNGFQLAVSGIDAYIEQRENGFMAFTTNNTERARITSGGDLLVGTTNSSLGAADGVVIGPIESAWTVSSSGNVPIRIYNKGSSGTRYCMEFRTASTAVGTITHDGTNTAYNTSSDYRLKNNPQPLTGSGAFIDALKPKTWNWKETGTKGVGFIAHEVQEVSPGSVVGTKDAVDEEGKPIMQAMEYGSAEFIANIIAELQSLRQRVALLEGN